jgi:GT2 family glycosyltransferase
LGRSEVIGSGRDDLSVTVVVPTHNRRARLGRLLGALAGLYRAGARFDVVVVVDGSTDGTEQLLAAFSPPYRLRAIAQAQGGAGAARNAGMRAATGEVLLFLDDDVVPQGDFVERHLEIHRRDRSAVVLGRIVPAPGSPIPAWHYWEATTQARQFAAMRDGHIAPSWGNFYTGNASVRREHAVAVGGFEESFVRGEDVEFGHRLADAGLRFHFAADALVHHEGIDRTLEGWLRFAFEYGRHAIALERRLGPGDAGHINKQWQEAHPLNRMLARWCVGHRARTRLVVGALTGAVGVSHAAPRWAQFYLCSALFSAVYWSGVAEATQLGPALWSGLIEPPLIPRTSRMRDAG